MACPWSSNPKGLPPAEEEFRRIEEYYPLLASTGCSAKHCQSGRMVHTDEPRIGGSLMSTDEVETEAIDFLRQLRRDDIYNDETLSVRMEEVKAEIRSGSASRHTWWQTTEELTHGVRLSWKHARKCIMRSEWATLKLYDFRHVKTSIEMGKVLIKALGQAFNNGDIKPSVFVFPPCEPGHDGPLVWNHQLLAFAGYKQPDGTILGDPSNVKLTEAIIDLGWQPPPMHTRWDLLPLVTMADGDVPVITTFSEDDFPIVPIRHHSEGPQGRAFNQLGLRWVPAPALSRLGFQIGGVKYTGAPFVGWFMDAEIGHRDLADQFRYNVLPDVAKALQIQSAFDRPELSSKCPYRRPFEEISINDLAAYEQLALNAHAQVELSRSVYLSFTKAGIRIIDSFTASFMYTTFDDQHLRIHGFRLNADAYWIAPPFGSVVPIWHRGGAPNYQPLPMIDLLEISAIQAWLRRSFTGEGRKQRRMSIALVPDSDSGYDTQDDQDGASSQNGGVLCLSFQVTRETRTLPTARIFYCSAGVTAQRIALKLEQHMKSWFQSDNDAAVLASASRPLAVAAPAELNTLDPASLIPGDAVYIVASSAGRGEVPMNGSQFLEACKTQPAHSLPKGTQFAIFGNGNSSYGENFNGAANQLRAALEEKCGKTGTVSMYAADTDDEFPPWGQFQDWIGTLRKSLSRDGHLPTRTGDSGASHAIGNVPAIDEDPTESLALRLPLLNKPAHLVAVNGAFQAGRGIRHVTLELPAATAKDQNKAAALPYAPMSHIDTFVPLSENRTKALLHVLKLDGNKIVRLGDSRQATLRQIISLVDLSRPFENVAWVDATGINLSASKKRTLLRSPLSESIETIPWVWNDVNEEEDGTAANTNNDDLVRFLAALPFLRPRTFSVASSPPAVSNFGSAVSSKVHLLVQTHAGGLFSDTFLGRGRQAPLYVHQRPGPAEHLATDSTKPLIAFVIGAGLAPLRSLLQARVAAVARPGAKKPVKPSISLLIGYRPRHELMVRECIADALKFGLVDMLLLMPSNPDNIRVQEMIFMEKPKKNNETKSTNEEKQPRHVNKASQCKKDTSQGEANKTKGQENKSEDEKEREKREEETRWNLVRRKVRDEGAHVFACASGEATDGFAKVMGGAVGVPDIRKAMGSRWTEEVFVAGL